MKRKTIKKEVVFMIGRGENCQCSDCPVLYGANCPFDKKPSKKEKEKIILDACCGGRMFWFDKKHPKVLYVDRRKVNPVSVGKGKNARMFSCQPDKIMDFRKLDLPSGSFSLIVFDPPHFTSLGEKSYMAQKYGALDKNTWKEDLTKGFAECFRVLKKEGILIFKWNEHDILLREVLKLTPARPLFGHPSGKAQKTHWVCFMKLPTKE